MKQPHAARSAVEMYAALVQGESNEPLETQAVDLMADLFHLLAAEGHDVDRLVGSAQFHFDTESDPDEDDGGEASEEAHWPDASSVSVDLSRSEHAERRAA
ncbi:hypothetical protein [Streptomyces sp. NPDC093261]|uniref:hypothetical protein n=1 Tax=Streptomyces sp. NPDC093261 TaxID=3366037 RepID=UPI003809D56A